MNALIKKTEVDYYSGIIQESSNNSRTLFSMVNKLLHKGVPAEYPSGCASDGDLANKFIDFFGEKITVLTRSKSKWDILKRQFLGNNQSLQ